LQGRLLSTPAAMPNRRFGPDYNVRAIGSHVLRCGDKRSRRDATARPLTKLERDPAGHQRQAQRDGGIFFSVTVGSGLGEFAGDVAPDRSSA
jgi:hypothetical protein